MKIEICSETRTTVLTSVLMVCVSIVICYAIAEYGVRTKAAFAAGYELRTLPGSSISEWQKVEVKK